jgi:tetratricopeptide (TPR) repeat protein
MRAAWAMTVFTLILGVNGLRAQPKEVPPTEGQVQYRDRAAGGKVANLSGQITESIAGVKIKPNVGDSKSILTGDIVDIVYNVTALYKLDYDSATKKEAAKGAPETVRKSLADAANDYAGLVAKMKPDDPKLAPVRRHLEFKIANLRATLADSPEQRDEAIGLLAKFRDTHKSAWQYPAVVLRLAGMFIDKEDFDNALKSYDELAKTEGVAKETKQSCDLLAIDVLMRGQRYADAEKRIADALRVLPPSDSQYGRMQIYQIGCQATRSVLDKVVAQLEAIIAKSNDPGQKALAYNTLGDAYRAKDRKKDAMWQYLWVDVVYNQDRVEHIKAMDRLARLFAEMNDTSHAEKYRYKLTIYR